MAADPSWAGVLTLSTAAAAVASAGFYSTGVGRQALVDRWERSAAAFGRELDDAAYADLLALADYGALYGAGSAIAGVALLTIGVAMVAFVALHRRDGVPTFRQVLAVTSHASVILALRLVIAAPVGYARETAAGATSIGVWMPMFNETSIVSRFLGILDVAVLWWVVVAAGGLAMLYGRRPRSVAVAFVGAYVAAALVVGALMTVLGSP